MILILHPPSSVRDSPGTGYGDVSDAAVAEQIAELNRAFGPAELRFELASIQRVDNCAWHAMTPGTTVEHDAMSSSQASRSSAGPTCP
jgi:hypothetical protein